MKKESSCLLALFSLLFTFHLNAQKITFGVKGGLNFSSFGGNYLKEFDTENKLGYNFGITANYFLSKDLYLMSGLEYSCKGSKESILVTLNEKGDTYKGNIKITTGYLQVPIRIGFKKAISSEIAVSAYAGPYFAYGIEDKVKGLQLSEEDSNPVFFGLTANRFDVGAGAGAEMEFQAHYFLQLGYDLGLLNISRMDGTTIRNRNFYISAGYRF